MKISDYVRSKQVPLLSRRSTRKAEKPPNPPPRTLTIRKPRSNVVDRVFVSSPTKVLIEVADNRLKEIEEEEENAEDAEEKDYDKIGEEIRKSKDIPKIRNRIFEESLESQEISFFIGEDDFNHYYETIYDNRDEEINYDYDSFESDDDSEKYFGKLDDSGVELSNGQLPATPHNQSNGIMKFAGKHMKKFRRNFSIDITKSLTRMTKRISRSDIQRTDYSVKENKKDNNLDKPDNPSTESLTEPKVQKTQSLYQNVKDYKEVKNPPDDSEKTKSLSGRGLLKRIRKSISLSPESAQELISSFNTSKSTFYITDTIDLSDVEKAEEALPKEEKYVEPVLKSSRSISRPHSPPPPVPSQNLEVERLNTNSNKPGSWSNESGIFYDDIPIRPTTFWYTDINLYESHASSPPSTSSTENSGSALTAPYRVIPKLQTSDFVNQDNKEIFNNLKNESAYYTSSISSFSSTDTKRDESLKDEMALRLQDEPLYQFYDAAIPESIYSDDFEPNNYDEISEYDYQSDKQDSFPEKRQSILFIKTLWCEVPEVVNSSVLSTLSSHQKKIQEAKFEILTSEASYLNSLNVLTHHFIKQIDNTDIITKPEREILFGKVAEVKSCSEKLLTDLEKCWHENVLLHGICDIVKKYAEENFTVYIGYCENQVLQEDTLNELRDRLRFAEFLKKMELNALCQSLPLFSFLMLPMQRITRWPLLIDAVLKRLSQQDPEYYTCQHALATVNKIVNQCNEAARKKGREIELEKISKKIEFSDGVAPVPIYSSDRWLIRSGSVVHLYAKNDESKLTIGKKLLKMALYLFLFNDMFFVSKEKSSNSYSVIHYCPRNLIEINTSGTVVSLTTKDTQGKHLIFLTILENQEGKTVEYMLSCSSETERERWIEAFLPPKSEDPEETLYEHWDCPQVKAIHNYSANQPDELPLKKGDNVNVLRKMTDGWYFGERIRDGQSGWFPANHTEEIANVHVRARHLKQRYRLLAFSENYLKYD